MVYFVCNGFLPVALPCQPVRVLMFDWPLRSQIAVFADIENHGGSVSEPLLYPACAMMQAHNEISATSPRNPVPRGQIDGVVAN